MTSTSTIMKYSVRLLVALSLLCPVLLQAGNGKATHTIRKEFVKEINRQFDISRKGEVVISNRHGKVDVKTWSRPEVKVDVKIIVLARDDDRARAVFERIDILFDHSDDLVEMRTRIKNCKSKGWASWRNWVGYSKGDDFEINYEVSIPRENVLDVRNKYGDTYVGETNGRVHAEIAYGSIRFEGVNNELNLDLGYGDATIIKADDITAAVGYSEIVVRTANDADLTTKYSKINMESVGSLRSITKYDDYTLNEVGALRAEGKYGQFNIGNMGSLIAAGKYTDFIIGTLEKDADVVLYYGGLSVETLKSGFGNIRLDGSYANFKITTEPGISYQLDADATYGDIVAPDNIDIIYKRDGGKSYRIEGVVGGGAPQSAIKVKVNYGDLRVR